MKKHFTTYTILASSIILLIGIASYGYFNPSKGTSQPFSYTLPNKPAIAPTIDNLLVETNIQRTENGVAPLTIDERLNVTAQEKCQDMLVRDYWSHDTPDGNKPWPLFTKHNVIYKIAGENLAYGTWNYIEPEKDITKNWMNSENHRINLLNQNFTNVGFGICKIDRTYQNKNGHNGYIVVQHLIRPR